MQSITEALANLRLGECAAFRSLSVFPLFGCSDRAPEYLTLDEALEQGLARVTEVSEGGSVPELAFENDGARQVLLVDGEELVGARQNRVLNLSILVAPKSKVVIPVSCVEQGRWRYASSTFASGKRNLYAKARAQKMAQVTESMRTTGRRSSNQSHLWDSISDKAERMSSYSDTGAMADIYEQQKTKLGQYTIAFTAQNLQVGAVFAINDQVVGVDMFDAPATFRKLMTRLIESYAMDALEVEEARESKMEFQQVKQFIADIEAAAVELFPPVGEGEDLRLSGKEIAGGALIADGRVVHLAAFRTSGGGNEPMAYTHARSRRERNLE